MARDRVKVMTDARHVAAHVLAAVVDARVLKAKEGDFNEFTSAQRHVPGIFSSDTELEEVELVDVLQEGAGVGNDLACRIAPNADGNVSENEIRNSARR